MRKEQSLRDKKKKDKKKKQNDVGSTVSDQANNAQWNKLQSQMANDSKPKAKDTQPAVTKAAPKQQKGKK